MQPNNLPIKFGLGFHKAFDEIINCKLTNRSGDTGLVEIERPALHPRDGAFSIANSIASAYSGVIAYAPGNIVSYNNALYRNILGSTGVLPTVVTNWTIITSNIQSDVAFYQDKNYVNRMYRTTINSTNVQVVQYLNNVTWTDIYTIPTNGFTSPHDAKMTTVSVPSTVSGTPPTAYTTPSAATAAERVKKNAGDALNAQNNVGKICMIMDGIYEGCYASILSWDAGNSEYVLSGSGIITALSSGTTYRLYDRMIPALQVITNGKDYYFDGITRIAEFDSKALNSLTRIYAVSTQVTNPFVFFKNVYWTFYNATLYYAGGTAGNPFFFNLVNSITLSSFGAIRNIFVFKNRLIILGYNYIVSLDQNLIQTSHTNSYGGIEITSNGDDAYIYTTDNRVVSLIETLSGTLSIQNFSEEAFNYISVLDSSTRGLFFDGQKLYIYGYNTISGYNCIVNYDIRYKYWGVWEGIRLRSILSYSGTTYFVGDNCDQVFTMKEGQAYDALAWGNTVFTQKLATKEIDLGDIFTIKNLSGTFISFEDITQALNVETYVSLNGTNGKKLRKKISFSQQQTSVKVLGMSNMGTGILGGDGTLSEISIPTMKKVAYSQVDSCNLFKIILTNTDSLFFYINQLDIQYIPKDEKYFFEKTSII